MNRLGGGLCAESEELGLLRFFSPKIGHTLVSNIVPVLFTLPMMSCMSRQVPLSFFV
jgi:hypothetical protein